MANRLSNETSPYLLQHKDNPVDWYPWGDEAFERARAEDKPVLLSIGYAACHWCHVMEKESFEDLATAQLMNDDFISIKVDREERPDVDAIYMDAVQALTGHGGWPMTMFLTPEGVPFYGGTYFPPEDRGGMPSFKRLLVAVAQAWRERREELEGQGRGLIEHINAFARMQPSDEAITSDVLERAYRGLQKTFDADYGGFGGAPKFPQPMTVDFLMRMSKRGHEEAGGMAALTLDAMAAGGMFDQLAGGFSRYSVDRTWTVPHFEKMLYDNAQLLRTYARSWLETGSERHRAVAEATAAWMLREMRDEGGGFWSSLDADSEGEEGKFYVWSLDEVREVTGDDADTAISHWGLTSEGNFEGRNIPVLADPSVDPEAVARARAALLQRRSERVRPATDTKVLTAWNALAASALAEAGSALGDQAWVAAAAEAMRFVLGTSRVEGRLMRSYRRVEGTADSPGGSGVVKHLGVCEDYAFVLEACLSLYEAGFDPDWLREARWAADEAIRLFADDASEGFFTTGSDAPALVARVKDVVDNAVPCANSVLALELQRLASLTGNADYAQRAAGAIRLVQGAIERSPLAFGHLLGAIDFHTGAPAEIVIVGDPSGPDTAALLAPVRARFIPNKVVIAADGPGDGALPLLDGRSKLNGRATAYLCRHGTCKLPVDRPELLEAQLAEL